jgi:hypothetical protein
MGEPVNVAEKLARELVRVAAMRERYREAQLDNNRRGGSANMGPAIYLMTGSIDAGCEAAGSGDAMAIIAAVAELEGFTAD